MNILRKFVGVIAAVLVLAMGVGLLWVLPIFGAMLLFLGIGLTLWQARELWRQREDPYDLGKLWEAPLPEETPDEPDESVLDGDSMAYCHLCGHAVPLDYARCPECGNPL